MDAEQVKQLLKPFTAKEINKLPKPIKQSDGNFGAKSKCRDCGGYHSSPAVHIDYVGHAQLTKRLLEVDPNWNWEPFATDERGLPWIDKGDSEWTFWIKLTIFGETRIGVGNCAARKHDAEKELIGDALRNAAMRFGLALDLWMKEKPADNTSQVEAKEFESAGITEKQMNLVLMEFKRIKIDEREKRLEYTRGIVQRKEGAAEINSVKDLTKFEASKLIEQLKSEDMDDSVEAQGDAALARSKAAPEEDTF